jgi:hypothetical protein
MSGIRILRLIGFYKYIVSILILKGLVNKYLKCSKLNYSLTNVLHYLLKGKYILFVLKLFNNYYRNLITKNKQHLF